MKNKIILGIGSNLGDKKQNIESAITEIEIVFQTKVFYSSIYETESWGFLSENSFLNVCIYFFSSLEAEEILKKTQQAEKKIGRTTKTLNKIYHSRTIDIDILYIGCNVLKSKDLTVPHPLIYERAFVLFPLAEICPDFTDPVKKDTIANLHKKTGDKNKVELRGELFIN